MTSSRRAVFKTGATVLATGLIGTIAVAGYRGRTIQIKIAGGEPDGLYLKVSERLAASINTAERGLICTSEATEGSVANIRLICEGAAHIGIATADTALAALADQGPFKSSPMPVKAIGQLYQNYLQLVVREDAPLYAVADLAGKKVSLGPKEGTAMFGMRILDTAKLKVVKRYLPLAEATTALENKEIDAMLWLGGVPTPALVELHNRVGIRLLPTAELLPLLRHLYGTVYRPTAIPFGSYGKAKMATIGVASLLLCASALTDGIVAAVTRVLIERAAGLVPTEALGPQFLEGRYCTDTFDIPKHPGAATAYQREHG